MKESPKLVVMLTHHDFTVENARDIFEQCKEANADVGALRQKFLGELRWFTDIVDTLRVEDTLYKKTNA